MSALLPYTPGLIAMGALVLASAFFSGSEAALFYLDRSARRRMAAGSRAQRIATGLLADPDRLLSGVLFWNLLVNIAIFTVSSIISLRLEHNGHHAEAGSLAVVSLVAVLLFGEMLPKSLAVLQPVWFATLVGIPLAALLRLADPLLVVLRTASVLSRRVLWPTFQEEPYLAIGDLERAVRLSTSNAVLLEQEETVLQGIVSLSSIRADELMRPRTQIRSFRPPVALGDLEGRITPSGYLLVTEPDSDELTAAINLTELWNVSTEHLEEFARPLIYVPWCSTVAEALEKMRLEGHQVAGVVNEFGETLGILTLDDILETIVSRTASRSERLLKRGAIRLMAPGVWHVTGMTSVRYVVRYFSLESAPPSRSVTLAGVVQEVLERLPQICDEGRWGPFQFRVLEVSPRRQILVELRRAEPPKEASP